MLTELELHQKRARKKRNLKRNRAQEQHRRSLRKIREQIIEANGEEKGVEIWKELRGKQNASRRRNPR